MAEGPHTPARFPGALLEETEVRFEHVHAHGSLGGGSLHALAVADKATHANDDFGNDTYVHRIELRYTGDRATKIPVHW